MPLSVTYPEVKCSRKCHRPFAFPSSSAPQPRAAVASERIHEAPPLDVPWPFRHVRETPTVAATSETMQSRDRGPPITLAQAYWLGRIPSFACNLPTRGLRLAYSPTSVARQS